MQQMISQQYHDFGHVRTDLPRSPHTLVRVFGHAFVPVLAATRVADTISLRHLHHAFTARRYPLVINVVNRLND